MCGNKKEGGNLGNVPLVHTYFNKKEGIRWTKLHTKREGGNLNGDHVSRELRFFFFFFFTFIGGAALACISDFCIFFFFCAGLAGFPRSSGVFEGGGRVFFPPQKFFFY